VSSVKQLRLGGIHITEALVRTRAAETRQKPAGVAISGTVSNFTQTIDLLTAAKNRAPDLCARWVRR
jgi:hypothetical protein